MTRHDSPPPLPPSKPSFLTTCQPLSPDISSNARQITPEAKAQHKGQASRRDATQDKAQQILEHILAPFILVPKPQNSSGKKRWSQFHRLPTLK
ncbi:hypothetical protein BaRGS_00003498 [Batillaria attramentaria]|uniref:Uncharacterized protein n=1 Tax=Batillaria attramentaria TaxID=370345 RepID=A0ABD0M218_9CAEN